MQVRKQLLPKIKGVGSSKDCSSERDIEGIRLIIYGGISVVINSCGINPRENRTPLEDGMIERISAHVKHWQFPQ